jgi:SAM-dependent methyltransferase
MLRRSDLTVFLLFHHRPDPPVVATSTDALLKSLVQTRRTFAAAGDSPAYLDAGVLQSLQAEYPYPPEYGYDPDTLERRGVGRATQLLGLPGAREAGSFLELACSDGMVSWALCREGKTATAIDTSRSQFDARARNEGVSLLQTDAADLPLVDGSVDFVFSYNAFEHFASPEAVLREAIRVLGEGGYIYLEFGPLYYSPFGEHAYRSITVPYCQFLFPKSQINDFALQNGLTPIDFSHVNGWSIQEYRELWKKYSHVLQRVRYKESVDLTHLDLIDKYPSCFRSKSDYFENFIVSNVSILCRKTDHPTP